MTGSSARALLALFCLVITAAGGAAAVGVAPRVAVFDFELIDTSLEGEMSGARADEQQRLVLISDMLRQKLAESDRFDVTDLGPARAEIAEAGYLHGCNGCATRIAGKLGADLAFTGTVQKVSNLILNINVYIWDVDRDALIRAMSVDIRGNTDESWSRGLSYLVRNRILKDAELGSGG